MGIIQKLYTNLLAEVNMQETENTKKATQTLRALTDKPIILTTIEEEARRTNTPYIIGWTGAATEEADRFIIALNHDEPDTHESTFVHEVIHFILWYSKYPKISIDETYARTYIPTNLRSILPGLVSTLTSSIEHPEVYRQMSDNYDLDMEAYFQNLLRQKVQKVNSFTYSSLKELLFLNQQTIVECIEYHYYSPSVKDELLRLVERKSADGYQIAASVIDEIDDNWAQSPENFRNAARLVLNRVIQYGDNNGFGVGENIWKALRVAPR